ncbi:MAG TPA: DUF4432 family protein, partial [Gemmatimonadaceae bacterium]
RSALRGHAGFVRGGASAVDLDARSVKTTLSLTVSYRPDQLPALFTWRMLGYETYVMAAEPANCPTIEGRIEAERRGTLPMLEPGESREYELQFDVRSL